MIMIPSYANIFLIFAISRTDDVNWGTRDVQNSKVIKKAKFKQYKVFYLLSFVISNLAFGLFM